MSKNYTTEEDTYMIMYRKNNGPIKFITNSESRAALFIEFGIDVEINKNMVLKEAERLAQEPEKVATQITEQIQCDITPSVVHISGGSEDSHENF